MVFGVSFACLSLEWLNWEEKGEKGRDFFFKPVQKNNFHLWNNLIMQVKLKEKLKFQLFHSADKQAKIETWAMQLISDQLRHRVTPLPHQSVFTPQIWGKKKHITAKTSPQFCHFCQIALFYRLVVTNAGPLRDSLILFNIPAHFMSLFLLLSPEKFKNFAQRFLRSHLPNFQPTSIFTPSISPLYFHSACNPKINPNRIIKGVMD